MEYLPSNTYIHEAREPVAEKSESDEARAKIEFYSFRNSYRAWHFDMLLKSLTESRIIRAEKLLQRRVRVALNSLDDTNKDDRQTPIFAYLIQLLQDPSNIIYQPLLLEISKLKKPNNFARRMTSLVARLFPADHRQKWDRELDEGRIDDS